MTRAVTVAVWCALLMTSPAAYGQTRGWFASAGILRVTARGGDRRVGDVMTEDVTFAGTATDFASSDVVTARAIAPGLHGTRSFMVEAGRRGTAWGFGGRVWRVSTAASATDTANSAPTADGVFHPTSVRFWNNTFLAPPDAFDPSGLAAIHYATQNTLEHLRGEGYAERAWFRDPMLSMTVRLGLAYARGENRQLDRLSTRGTATHATSDEARVASSEATFDLVGPLLALTGSSAFGRFSVGWLLSTSALGGTDHESGTFELSAVTQTMSDDGIATMTSKSDRRLTISDAPRHVVPALDLQVDTSYRITRNVELGARILTSSLFNMPVAPEFDAQLFAWNLRANDIAFLAFSVFARVTL